MEPVYQVVLPLAAPGFYSYTAPEVSDRDIGKRCIVQFGPTRFYTGIIFETAEIDSKKGLKEVVEILDDKPIFSKKHLDSWKWISEYYMCHLGEVYSAVMPSIMRMSSETVLTPFPGFKSDDLTDREQSLFNQIEEKTNLKDLSKKLEEHRLVTSLHNLVAKGALLDHQQMKIGYRAKKESYIRLLSDDISSINPSKAPKQIHALEHLYEQGALKNPVHKLRFMKGVNVSTAVLKALEKKGMIALEEVTVSRVARLNDHVVPPNELSRAQSTALNEVELAFKELGNCLLQGVTSSGKTEIYIHLILEAIRNGKSALYLLPEIALTSQIILRVSKHFGDEVRVYHSRMTDAERHEVFMDCAKGEVKLLIGARSSALLPMRDLGLIIVDEEHDGSYKQVDPAPRYQVRDLALILGQMFEANVLLGSATPSMESLYLVEENKIGFVSLTERYGKVALPEVDLIDLKRAYKTKQMTSFFSKKLLEAIVENKEAGLQSILFQNRRGYSAILQCQHCGYVRECPNCDIGLSYHKSDRSLSCHYCGHKEGVPSECSNCQSGKLTFQGVGTERIVEELELLVPDLRILRLDQDTARGRRRMQYLIDQFSNGDADVLVGTQMITKGLDFERVTLVGVVQADNLLFFPEYRAHERAVQLLHQVSGRSGRRSHRGRIMIQTFQPEHPAFQHLDARDYNTFAQKQNEQRKLFKYPPFYRLIRISILSKVRIRALKVANRFVEGLNLPVSITILGPEPPVVARIQNQFIQNILIKFPRTMSNRDIKQHVLHVVTLLKESKKDRGTRIKIDVDP